MRLILLAVYIAVGAMLHALVVGAALDWSSAWTFAWVFGWPIMLMATFSAFIITASIVIVLLWIGWEWLKTIAHWRAGRKSNRI
ncbi:MAG: hypothetical protein GC182_08560 [Rhodopseudomonas sp.]|nr:hypothetical protein [Rhodopseudomonas sp.]